MANSGEEGHAGLVDDIPRRPTTSSAPRRTPAAKGGQVHMEPMQVAENGSFAIIGDPGGAGIGAWQAGPGHGLRDLERAGRAAVVRAADARATTRPSTSTGRVRLEHQHVQRHARVPLHDASRRRGDDLAGSWTRAAVGGSRARLDDLLRRRGHGRRPRAGRRARRQGDAACQGHAVGSPGAGCRSHGHVVQVDGERR